MSEAGLIERLSKRVWADPGLRKLRAARPGNERVYGLLGRTARDIEKGRYESAAQRLEHGENWARRANDTQTRYIHALMGELAAVYVRKGDSERAVRLYEKMLPGSRSTS